MVIEGDAIRTYQLIVVRAALRMEKAGMKHSRGAIRPKWAKALGLKPRASHDAFISKLTEMIEAGQK